MTAYGIDFGTTNSALAVINNGEIEIARIDNPPVEWDRLGYDKVFPSVFGYGPNRETLFGWEAKLSNTDTKLEAVKRLFATEDSVQIGDELFLVDEIATMLFSQIKRSLNWAVHSELLGLQSNELTKPSCPCSLAKS